MSSALLPGVTQGSRLLPSCSTISLNGKKGATPTFNCSGPRVTHHLNSYLHLPGPNLETLPNTAAREAGKCREHVTIQWVTASESGEVSQASQKGRCICPHGELEITSSIPMVIQLAEVASPSGHLLSLRVPELSQILKNILGKDKGKNNNGNNNNKCWIMITNNKKENKHAVWGHTCSYDYWEIYNFSGKKREWRIFSNGLKAWGSPPGVNTEAHEWASSLKVFAKCYVQMCIFQRELIHSFHRGFQGIHHAEKVKVHFSRLGMRSLNRRSSYQGAQERRNSHSHLTYRTYTSMHLHTNIEMRTISWLNHFPSIKLF